MANNETNRKSRELAGRLTGPGALFVTALFAAGCSQIPDAVNPVEWYDNTVEFFSGEDDASASKSEEKSSALVAERGTPPPGNDGEFPKLSSVDQQQQRYEARAQGLVADVEGRKYAPAVPRQGEALNVLGQPPKKPPAPAMAAAPAQPAPPAMPVSPVTAEPPQQVASAPATTSPETVFSTADQGNFQERFAKRLSEIRARASEGGPALPLVATQPIGSGGFDTVIVSADGVQAGYASPALAPSAAPVETASAPAFGQRRAPAVAQGAVKVATIHFGNGSSNLNSRDRSILRDVLRLQKERGGRIHVIGHASSRTRNTDPVRHKMINFQVSAARADAVARELVRLGAPKMDIQVDAVSDSQPRFYEFMPSGEAGNRRAEIYLES